MAVEIPLRKLMPGGRMFSLAGLVSPIGGLVIIIALNKVCGTPVAEGAEVAVKLVTLPALGFIGMDGVRKWFEAKNGS